MCSFGFAFVSRLFPCGLGSISVSPKNAAKLRLIFELPKFSATFFLKSFSEDWLARSELLLPISIDSASINGCSSYLMIDHLISMVSIIRSITQRY
jgi:hypothetical protein